MNKLIVRCIICFLMLLGSNAHADLNAFLSGLNARASADINGFHAKVSTQFGVPVSYVTKLTRKVANPSDAFMCLQLSLFSDKHIDEVVKVYRANQGKGWGVIAKELGIKPGSAEFHALKKGDFALTGTPGVKMKKTKKAKGKSKGKGKGKGHKK